MIPHGAGGQMFMSCVIAVYMGSADLLRPVRSGFVLLYVLYDGDQTANGSPAAGFAAVP